MTLPGVQHRATELAEPPAPRKTATPVMPQILVPRGGRFVGLVTFQGDVVVEGEIEGEVHGSGRLELEGSAAVRGDVVVDEICIAGSLEGNVRALHRIEVRAGATVRGTLEAPYLVIADGCRVDGRCIMRIEEREAELDPARASSLV
jgi:cytoskeletal protein CcmA (bactofilin family)